MVRRVAARDNERWEAAERQHQEQLRQQTEDIAEHFGWGVDITGKSFYKGRTPK
jgi:hypothetical protein